MSRGPLSRWLVPASRFRNRLIRLGDCGVDGPQAARGGGLTATVSIPIHDAPRGAQSECAAPLSEQLPRYGGTLGI